MRAEHTNGTEQAAKRRQQKEHGHPPGTFRNSKVKHDVQLSACVVARQLIL
jgi:hypothetical protein